MLSKSKLDLTLLFLVLILWHPLATIACSTCGCSELCPLVMIEEGDRVRGSKGALSDSIWGNMILKMAYLRDPEIQRLMRHRGGVNSLTNAAFAGVIGGTVAQNIISLSVLNPPAGQSDSYLPGSLGLGLSGVVNIGLGAQNLLNWRLTHKIRERQGAVRLKVEGILQHLEYSESSCPEAQKDLAEIIGPRAARDCIKLWQSSHALANAQQKDKTLSDADGQAVEFKEIGAAATETN
jgi:hypothetical protein